jgi:hypothetical protein
MISFLIFVIFSYLFQILWVFAVFFDKENVHPDYQFKKKLDFILWLMTFTLYFWIVKLLLTGLKDLFKIVINDLKKIPKGIEKFKILWKEM